jgi:hypothetical protein
MGVCGQGEIAPVFVQRFSPESIVRQISSAATAIGMSRANLACEYDFFAYLTRLDGKRHIASTVRCVRFVHR